MLLSAMRAVLASTRYKPASTSLRQFYAVSYMFCVPRRPAVPHRCPVMV